MRARRRRTSTTRVRDRLTVNRKKPYACVTRQSRQNDDDDFGKTIDRRSKTACVCTTISASLRLTQWRKVFNTHNSLMSIFRPAAQGRHDQTFASEFTDCGGQTAVGHSGCVWCGLWCGVSCCTRVCPYSVRYRVAVRACVRALWCGTVRCGAVRSGARVRRAVVPLVRRRRNVLHCRPSASASSDLRFC